MLKKHFPHKGFSLVEVLISLIIVTSILAAMTPIISKKLLSSGVFLNVKGGGFVCKDGKYLENKKCIDCPKGFFCKENEKTPCPEGQISDMAQSECTPCEDGFYANENQDKCVKCEEGYKCSLGVKTVCPDGSYSSAGQAFCTPCPEGYYCKDGEKKSCETKFTNCNICNNSSCLSCKTGYEVENGKCVFKGFSQSVCNGIAKNLLYIPASQNGGVAACVTKANVGDTYNNGPYINSIAWTLSVVNAGTKCSSSACCWRGNGSSKTSIECEEKDGSGSTYSGCTRTVCDYNGAKLACENWAPTTDTKGKWRLPKEDELSAWGSNATQLILHKGKSGLELCSVSSSHYGATQCGYSNECDGARYDYCYPFYVWAYTEDESSSYGIAYKLDQTSFYGGSSLYKNYAASARCVLDEKTYFGTSSGSSGGTTSSSLPKTLTSQADCDKFGKNLLFLTSSQNGGKAACVTKANVGDSYNNGPDLDKIKSSAGITVVNAGSSCGSSSDYSSKCCWLGNNVGTTSNSCSASGNGNSTYSGCKRTVCTWAAAKAACNAYEPDGSGTKGKWRLPTQNELSAWGNNLSSIQKNQGKNGLELCDNNSGYGSVLCFHGYTSACPGAMYRCCYPTIVWSSDENSSSSAYYHDLDSGAFTSYYLYKTYAFSARCVLDEDAVKSL